MNSLYVIMDSCVHFSVRNKNAQFICNIIMFIADSRSVLKQCINIININLHKAGA